ncbi:bystin [Trichogramma pretiosum]|uniref:bystin n=1 Tax=Trichogramma pretiosum TaxID=7493 RepID=UPI0006C9E456|nr:bystin [Trichogramma pretiosum]
MGKAKKVKVSSSMRTGPPKKQVHTTLAEAIESALLAKPKNRNKTRVRQDKDEQYLESKISQKILNLSNKQRQEEEGEGDSEAEGALQASAPVPTRSLGPVLSDEEENNDSDDGLSAIDDYEEIKLDEQDEKDIFRFMTNPKEIGGNRFREIINGKRQEIETQFDGAQSVAMQELDPKVKKLYEDVGKVLSKYRSGKIPKPFKAVPSFRNWEQIMYVTDPDHWTAAAVYQATRLFASNMKENMAQRFYNLVLLPRLRDDMQEYKRLNFHLYQALRKALYKPGAFMKGILLPLLESGNCTLREALIVGSVVAKNSIPILHSATALLKIAEMEYNGANSIFLRILFDKKYALPYRVIDGCVFHFVQFERDPREMPVLWHQALLTFVQRYKNNISDEQKEALLQLIKKKNHHVLSAEIRRELHSAKGESEMAMEE